MSDYRFPSHYDRCMHLSQPVEKSVISILARIMSVIHILSGDVAYTGLPKFKVKWLYRISWTHWSQSWHDDEGLKRSKDVVNTKRRSKIYQICQGYSASQRRKPNECQDEFHTDVETKSFRTNNTEPSDSAWGHRYQSHSLLKYCRIRRYVLPAR